MAKVRMRMLASFRATALLVALATALTLACAHPRCALAEIEDTDPSKAIAVAYDNSGSMSDGSDKWCMAKYSLEVLASMLGQNDTMRVYPMRSEDNLDLTFGVTGTTPAAERVRVVHDANLGLGHGTNPEAAQEAYEYLTTVDAERYLVITTDGKFNAGNGLEDVKATVAQCKRDGIKVLYLAIGDSVDLIESDGDKVIVKQVVASDVLKTMTEFANEIFGRAELPERNFDTGKSTLSFDVPMGTIIVFAQGEGASLGLMKGEDGTTVSPDIAKVRYSEEPFARIADDAMTLSGTSPANLNATYRDTSIVNTDLMGQVGVYRGPIEAGTYQLDISGADVVEAYYKPYVDIATTLRSRTSDAVFELSSIGEAGPLLEDTYDVSYSVVNPIDGSLIVSDLLQGASFSTTITSDGSEQVVAEGDPASLSVGDVKILSTADVPGGVRITKDYGRTHVVAEMQGLVVTVTGLERGIMATKLNDQESMATVSITKANGEPITDDEWQMMSIDCLGDAGPRWEVEKGDVGTARLRPTYGDRSVDETVELLGDIPILPRTYPFTCAANIADIDHPYSGSTDVEVTFYPDPFDIIIRYWWALASLALMITILVLYMLKPRLPRRITILMDGDDLDEGTRFPFRREGVKHRLAPLIPEEYTVVTTRFTDATQTVPLTLPLLTIVAAKGKGGRKGKAFRFDKDTCRKLHNAADNGDLENFTPAPETVYNFNKTFVGIYDPEEPAMLYNITFRK